MNTTDEPPAETGAPLRFFSKSQRILVDTRRRVCSTCDSKRSLTALTVNCRSCGCAGVSFLHGRCHLHKWPSRSSENSNEADGHALPSDVDSRQAAVATGAAFVADVDVSPGQRIQMAVAEYERDTQKNRQSQLPVKITSHTGQNPVIDRIAVVGHPSRDYLWILRRKPKLDPALYEQILE